ncbi:DNA polymerase III subunit beta [Helicobacter sp. 11S02629-2]|uniref:DNA polymerase III subunit beta n=1 Tax=Helicobacter sp. 11S02629-2 TaxID=1476195 RepID=UPI000BA5E906|nr:DNA polymerase III subunit beta [Helicobacter sp. 11S02629-2]PAF45635.1 DNA polymerase III subunit beta [Helicobacter sp. 11S02629-2]
MEVSKASIKLDKNLFENTLANSQNALNKKVIEITSNIFLRIENAKLVVEAYNQVIYIRSFIDIKDFKSNSNEEFICAINGELLFNTIRSFSNEDISIDLFGEYVVIKQGRSKIKLPIYAHQSKAFKYHYEDMEKLNVENTLLVKSIQKVLHACNSSSTSVHPAMQGIFLDFNDNKLDIVATDSKRLAIVENEIKSDKEPFNIIISKNSINEVIKVFNNDFTLYLHSAINEENNIKINDMVGVVGNNIELYIKLINANFPEYKKALPKTELTQVKVKKEELIQGLKKVLVLTDKVIVTFKPEEIILKSLSGVNGSSANIAIDTKTDIKEDFSIGMNVSHIFDCISQIDNEFINFYFESENKPFLIKDQNFLELFINLAIN